MPLAKKTPKTRRQQRIHELTEGQGDKRTSRNLQIHLQKLLAEISDLSESEALKLTEKALWDLHSNWKSFDCAQQAVFEAGRKLDELGWLVGQNDPEMLQLQHEIETLERWMKIHHANWNAIYDAVLPRIYQLDEIMKELSIREAA